jgi:uncharacterized protein
MARQLLFPIVVLVFGAGLALAAGCGSTGPYRLYLLHPLAADGPEGCAEPDAIVAAEEPTVAGETAATGKPAVAGKPTATGEVALRLGPLTLPEYLDRPQIVTRAGPNEVRLAEFDRWAEPLRNQLIRVLGENLSLLLASDRVFPFPAAPPVSTDFQVTLDVIGLDIVPDREVSLSVRWTLENGGGETLLVRKASFSHQARPAGSRGGFDNIAEAVSAVVATLSREIATAITSLEKK